MKLSIASLDCHIPNQRMELNSLPVIVQLNIFSYLTVLDVMRIRLVCRQWNTLVNSEFKFKHLRCYHFTQVWKSEYDFNFKSTKLLLDYVSKDPKFSRIKYFEILLWPKYAELDDTFDLLNSFKFLEETRFTLEIKNVYLVRNGRVHRNPRFRNLSEVQSKKFVVSLDRPKKANLYFD